MFKEGDNDVSARTVGGRSSTRVIVKLVVLVITVPGTYYFVIAMRSTHVLAVVVYGVVPKVTLYPGGGTVLVWVFLLGDSSLVIGMRFRFGD